MAISIDNDMNIHSRAIYFISLSLKEIENYYENNLVIKQNKEFMFDKFRLTLTMKDNSIWRGYKLELQLIFTEDYPYECPFLYFILPVFHPNVHPKSGEIGLNMKNYLQENRFNLVYFIESVVDLIRNPNLSHGILNNHALKMIKTNFEEYKKTICKPKSKKDFKSSVIGENKTGHNQKEISFRDYQITWNGIATSKAEANSENPYLNQIQHQPNILFMHHGINMLNLDSYMQQEKEKMDIHSNLAVKSTISNNKQSNSSKELENVKPQIIDSDPNLKMVIHINQSINADGNPNSYLDNIFYYGEEASADEEEMQNLVEWTSNLKMTDI